MPRQSPESKLTPVMCNLGKYRRKTKDDVAAAAKKLGLSIGTYSTIESGHSLPGKLVLDRICKLYKCIPLDLYEPEFVRTIEAWYLSVLAVNKIREETNDEE